MPVLLLQQVQRHPWQMFLSSPSGEDLAQGRRGSTKVTPSIGILSWELPEFHAAQRPPRQVVLLYLMTFWWELNQSSSVLQCAELSLTPCTLCCLRGTGPFTLLEVFLGTGLVKRHVKDQRRETLLMHHTGFWQ